MLNELNNPQTMDMLISFGAFLTLFMGLGVCVSLLGTPCPVPLRRKR